MNDWWRDYEMEFSLTDCRVKVSKLKLDKSDKEKRISIWFRGSSSGDEKETSDFVWKTNADFQTTQ